MNFVFKFSLFILVTLLASCQFDMNIAPTGNGITLSSKPSAITNSTSANFIFKARETNSTYKCKLDGGTETDCTSPVNYPGLIDSSHTFTVYALDSKLKKSDPVTYTWIVDTTPPTLNVSSSPTTPTNSSAANFLFSATDTNGIQNYECSLDAGSYRTCASNVSVLALATGTHTYNIRAKDRAGNTSTVFTHTWLVDLEAPTVTITAKPDEATISDSATFSFTGNDTGGSGLSKFECRLDSASFSDCTTGISYSSLAGGTHTFFIRAVDAASNASTIVQHQWIIDTTDPVLNTFTIAEGALSVGIPLTSTQTTITAGGTPVTHVMFSENASFTGATWEIYNDNKTFMLSNINGTKTVYARVKSASGRISNTLTATTDLQSGILPKAAVTSPAAATTYNGGDSMPIAWNCEAGAGSTLHTAPVSQIQYSIDDGRSWYVIASDLPNNVSATSGSYTWNIPSSSPAGTAITNTTPIRVSVSCRSSAGVVINSLSPIINSPWSVFAGEPGNLNEGVHINAVDMSVNNSNNQSFHTDSKGSIFYSKLNAILYIDSKTGLSTRFVGDPYSPTCSLASLRFISPVVLGVTSSDEAVIFSQECSSLAKVRISDKSIVWTKQLPTINILDELGIAQRRTFMYSPLGYFVYYSNNSLYLQNLNTIASAPVRIFGTPGSCGVSVEGQFANTQPLPCKLTTDENFGLAMTADLSKIWLQRNSKSQELTKDISGNYIVATNEKVAWGVQAFDLCIFMKQDLNKVYCRGQKGVGNRIVMLNLVTEAWSINYTMISQYKSITSPFFFGDGGNSLLAYAAATNQLFRLTENPTDFTPNIIGGEPFLSYGNTAGVPNGVAFTGLSGFDYDETNNYFYVRGIRHLRRFVVDPVTKLVTQIATGYNSGVGNSSAYGTLYVSKDGTKAAANSLGGVYTTHWGAYNLTNFNVAAETVAGLTALYNSNHATPLPPYPTLGNSFQTQGGLTPRIVNVRKIATYLPNGTFYWMGSEDDFDQQNLYLFQSVQVGSTTTTTAIAGAPGLAGYSTNGNVASGAGFEDVYGMQPDAAGDLIILDGPRMRKVTVTTDTAPLKILDLEDFSTYTYYPNLKWTHATCDLPNDWCYFVITSNGVDRDAQVWMANLTTEEFTQIRTAGLTLPIQNSTWMALQLKVTPLGLMMLDTMKNRVLMTPLAP